MERYGNRIAVTGGQDFKNNIVRAAVAAKLPITFADAKLERERQLLTMASRRPSVPRIGASAQHRRPPSCTSAGCSMRHPVSRQGNTCRHWRRYRRWPD